MIDPSIPLQSQVAPIGNMLLQGYQAGSQMRQQRDEQPIRNQLMQTQLAGAKQQQQAGAQRQLNDEQKSLMMGSAELMEAIKANDLDGARSILQRRQAAAKTLGLPDTHSAEGLQMLEQGGIDALRKPVTALYQAGLRSGVLQEPYTRGQSLTGDVQLAREMGIDLSTEQGRQAFQQFKLGQRPATKGESGYYVPVQTGEGMRILNSRTGQLETPTGSGGAPLMAPAIDPKAQAAVVDAKTSAKVAAENRTEKEALAGSDAINLFNEFEAAIQAQPATSAGRTYEGLAGRVGAGNEAEQVAIAQADTIASQLMAYANKLPGPASDKDRVDFKASIGAYEKDGATRAQKLAAVRQAKASFQRLIDKYGKDGAKPPADDDWSDL